MSRRATLTLAVVLLYSAPVVSHAADAPPRVSMRWNAPDDCPDDAALMQAVEGLLGQALMSQEQQLAISINVLGGSGGYSAKLSFKGPQGSLDRFLEHPDCSKLAEAVALLTALAIDPERVSAHQAQAGSTEQGPQPDLVTPKPVAPEPSEPPPTPPPAPRNAPREASPRLAAQDPAYSVTLGAAGIVGVGSLPSATPGVSVDLALRRQRFRAAVIGRYWLTSSAQVSGLRTNSIELSLATAGLRACVLPFLGDVSLLACAGADVGGMTGSGEGVDNARTRRDLFAAAEGSLALSYTRSRLAPFAGVGGSVSLVRPRFGISRDRTPEETFRPSQAGFVV